MRTLLNSFSLAASRLELVAKLIIVDSDTSCVADITSVCMVFRPGLPYKLSQFSSS
jgi:hypothetical protein